MNLRPFIFIIGTALTLAAGCTTTPPARVTPHRAPLAANTGLMLIASDSSAAFARIMAGIIKQWPGPVEVYRLTGQSQADASLLTELKNSRQSLAVAVGLPAAQMARQLSNKKVVFCQVFNYNDAKLVRPWMKGVSMLPSAAEQFRAWKRVNPRLERVGVISGKGLGAVIDQARSAAARQDIQLVHFQSNSDLETLRVFENNSQIEAWWVLPDNRVLSRSVLHKMLTTRIGAHQLLLVNGDQAWGSLLTAAAEPDDIVELVVARLHAALSAPRGVIPGPSVLPLRQARIWINRNLQKTNGVSLATTKDGHDS